MIGGGAGMSSRFARHGEIFVADDIRSEKSYRCGNHVGGTKPQIPRGPTSMIKSLVKFDPVKFDENLRRIRVDFAQNPRLIANGRFKAVC